LRRVRTTHLDLWQLHDLRTQSDLARIFSPGGALEALVQARAEGLVRFLGVTGHHDPAILQEAMRRFPFDTALLAVNAADIHRLAFIPTALADAAQRGMGVIGMKIYAQGALLGPDKLTAEEAMGYVLSLPGVSTVVVGCRTPAEVDDNVRLVRQFAAVDGAHRRQLETRTQRYAAVCTAYKKSA
jgi:predicted aldo/keto reductase-like oxidoreductase